MEQAMLKPCQYRSVSEEGQLVCAKIARGDREVTAEICGACPVAAIDCKHLRFSLEKQQGGTIFVRYANGKSEVWNGEPAGVRLQRAACALLCVPLSGPATCLGCVLRQKVDGEREIAPAAAAGAGGKVLRLHQQQETCTGC